MKWPLWGCCSTWASPASAVSHALGPAEGSGGHWASPWPSVHLWPPACGQWPCLSFRGGRRQACSHDLLADKGCFPGRTTKRCGTGRDESDQTGGTVLVVGRWTAVAAGVRDVCCGGSFGAVAVFQVPGSHSFCGGHPAAFGEDGQ